MASNIPYSIPLSIPDLIPWVEIVSHNSYLHGRAHIARVMIHALILIQKTGKTYLETPLWAAVFLHDIARNSDGACYMHGEWAIEKWQSDLIIKNFLKTVGVRAQDHPSIITAVTNHCRAEIPHNHPHYELTALLKDADALDRVRLYDLNPRMLRHPESLSMIDFAHELWNQSESFDYEFPDLMLQIWKSANSVIQTTHFP